MESRSERGSSWHAVATAALCLALFAALAASQAAPAAAAGNEEEGCVEKLLNPPRPTAELFVESPGRLPGGGGAGQKIVLNFEYAPVVGCDSLERIPFVRLQWKRAGAPWEFLDPSGAWRPFGPTDASGARADTFGATIGATRADLARCEGGARPRFRVMVKSRARNSATGRTLGTSPTTIHPVPYSPASAGSC
jgi:hypothetical protein